MNEEERNRRIEESRRFTRWTDEDFESDQMLRRPQPPLVKPASGAPVISLPAEFHALSAEDNLLTLLSRRRSYRIYTEEPLSLAALSFLCWAQQGVKGIRGSNYATLRTVPSGGARHAFELYLYIRRVEGLEAGFYHYLPMTHSLELLRTEQPEDPETITKALCGQKWALKGGAIFFYSLVPARGEWRYAFDAHRVMMMDFGYVNENLYLAAAALHLGTCAIGAVDTDIASALLKLDGTEEYVIAAAPVGLISEANEEAEQSFYSFLKITDPQPEDLE